MKNVLDWGKIKDGFSGFEKLALLYVKKFFKNSSWTETPATKDGNKDAVAVVVGYQEDIIGEQKWWMEAKYSTESVSLTRYRLDATIVSAILEKNVTKIIFVTNVILKPKTIVDLQSALVLATGYDDIRFVCKYDLEYWLYQNPEIMHDFFKPEDCTFDLFELFIINKAEFYNRSMDILSFKESLQFLQKEISYRMHFSIYCPEEKESQIVSNSSLSGIKILSEKKLQLHPGENRITIDFKLTEKFPGKRKKVYNSQPLFYIDNHPIISEKLITISENSKEYLILEYQKNILNILDASLQSFIKNRNFKLYDIIGESGSGKSFIINNFLEFKDCRKNNVYYFEFSNSSADNIIALVNLIINMHFPYLASEDVDIDYINRLCCNSYISLCFRKLIEFRFNFEEINKTLVGISNADEILPVNLNINSRVVILDNIQKLRDIEKVFLMEIIQGLYKRNAPVFFLIIEQSSINDMLYDKLAATIPLERLDCQLEPEDILKYLRNQSLFCVSNDDSVNYQILFPNIIDLLMYLNYLKDVKQEISNMDSFYLSYRSFLNSDIANIYILNQFNKLPLEKKEVREYCDIIFWSDHGLPQTELDQNGIKVIESLFSQNLIKYNSNGEIIPSHDIYKTFYQDHYKPVCSDFLISNQGLTNMALVISSNLFTISEIYDYSKQLRKLINDQRFYTVHYILEGVFHEQNSSLMKNRISEELYYELYMLYAIANTNISKKVAGKKIFEKISNETANNSNDRIIRIHEEATWELINSFYDSLMFYEAIEKIKELILTLNKMKLLGILKNSLLSNIRYHDVMVIKSLIEADMGVSNHFIRFTKRHELMVKYHFDYRAKTFSVRYAQTIMRCMPQMALQLFESAMKEIECMHGIEDKYYLWSAFNYYYMLIIFQNDFTVLPKLFEIHEKFKTNYYNDYRKRLLGIAVLYFQIGDFMHGFQYIFSDAYTKREKRPRQMAFYYETMALSEVLQKNYNDAYDYLKKAASILENMPEYEDIVLHNICIIEKESFSQNSIMFCFEKSLRENIYYLDPRCIW